MTPALPQARATSLPSRPQSELPAVTNPLASSMHQQKVAKFMRLAGQVVRDQPEMCSPEERLRCVGVLLSEVFELIMEGLAVNIKIKPLALPGASQPYVVQFKDLVFEISRREPNLELTVDGVVDTRVTATAVLCACGVRDAYPQDLVDENNLLKFDPAMGGYRSDGSDGNPAGKWIKGKNHPKPDLVDAINLQLAPDSE